MVNKLDERGIAHLLLMGILIVGIVFGVYLVGQKTNLFPKAALSCKSDETRKPVEVYCMGGSLVQVSEWAESGSCKLFYEITDRPCSELASPSTNATSTPTAQPTGTPTPEPTPQIICPFGEGGICFRL